MKKTKQYKVVISERARQLLTKQVTFLAQKDIEVAKKVRTKIIKATVSLQTLPNRYPFLNEQYLPISKYHKMYVPDWYLLIYQIKDDTVYIDYILDCRQDYQWLIK